MHRQNLYEQLAPLAAKVRKQSRTQYRLVGHAASECQHHQDWLALSESCVFLAYQRMGPAALSTPRSRARLVVESRKVFLAALQDGQSTYYDYYMRQRIRKDISAFNRWDSWQRGAVERVATGHAAKPAVIQDVEPPPQEVELQQALDLELLQDLREHLRPAELQVVLGHYIDGRSQRDLARDLVAREGRRQNAQALRKAETRVNVMLHRARTRLRKVLHQRWAVRAQEI